MVTSAVCSLFMFFSGPVPSYSGGYYILLQVFTFQPVWKHVLSVAMAVSLDTVYDKQNQTGNKTNP